MCLTLIDAVQTLSSRLYFLSVASAPSPLIKVHPHPRKLPFLFMSLSFSWRHFAHAGVRSEPAAPFIRHTYSEPLTSTQCHISESTSMKIAKFIQIWVMLSLSFQRIRWLTKRQLSDSIGLNHRSEPWYQTIATSYADKTSSKFFYIDPRINVYPSWLLVLCSFFCSMVLINQTGNGAH